jgi:hypothetical protein
MCQDSQVGVPKLLTLGLSRLWGPMNFCADLRLRWVLKQSCSPRWELSNGMSHAIWTQWNWVDSWPLVVGNQIVNLSPGPSFDHNLCFKCPNGSQSIYTSTFQGLFNDINNSSSHWALTIAIAFWRFGNPLGLHLPKWELPWECEGSFPHTFSHSREHVVWLLSFFFAHNLASPFCFGREPKARVATRSSIHLEFQFKFYEFSWRF